VSIQVTLRTKGRGRGSGSVRGPDGELRDAIVGALAATTEEQFINPMTGRPWRGSARHFQPLDVGSSGREGDLPAVLSGLGGYAEDLIRSHAAGAATRIGQGRGRPTAAGTQRMRPYSTRPLWVPETRTAAEEPIPEARRAYDQRVARFDRARRRESTGRFGGNKRSWVTIEGGYAEFKGTSVPNMAVSGRMLRDLRVRVLAREVAARSGSSIAGKALEKRYQFVFEVGSSTQRSLRLMIAHHYGTAKRVRHPGLPARPFALFTADDEEALVGEAERLFASGLRGVRTIQTPSGPRRAGFTARGFRFLPMR